jgi:hypothetical protein
MLKVKKEKNIGHFVVRFLAGTRQSDHTCCWNIIFAVRFLAWRKAKGEWAKAVGKAGATGGESPALPTALVQAVGKAGLSPQSARRLCQQLRPMLSAKQIVGKAKFFANSLVQRICQQHGPMLLANQAVGKAVVPFANRTLPTAVASLLVKVTAAELTASPLRQRYTWLLAKLSQQCPRSCWRRALSHHLKCQRFFPNRNSETLLGKPSPTGLESSPTA